MATPRAARPSTPVPAIHPRLRVVVGDEIALGPGKVALLAGIEESGSIRVAAAGLGMSYMRAWSLVRTMNACFRVPLVAAARGGTQGGGTRLTDAGREVLAAYRRMEAKCEGAIEADWSAVRALLRG